MAGNSAFEMVQERGWQGGLRNLLRSEFGRWWKTRLWWTQGLMWAVILNFILGAVIWNPGAEDVLSAPTFYSLFAGLFPSIAVVIIMQDVLVGEKESGTAAWVLSKPVSRPAFILAKLAAHLVGVLVTIVIFPGVVAYVQISLAGQQWLNPLDFAAGLGVLWVYMLYYLTLTLMLGTFFNHRAPVIGIPLGLSFGQQMIFGILPVLVNVLPWTLAVPLNGSADNSIAAALMLGQTPANMIPFYAALVCIVIFIALSLWRFEREEF